jgi:hypothetical protein
MALPFSSDDFLNCMKLLSLSKKSKWRILTILTSIKINYLPTAEYSKNVKFQVFRQAR